MVSAASETIGWKLLPLNFSSAKRFRELRKSVFLGTIKGMAGAKLMEARNHPGAYTHITVQTTTVGNTLNWNCISRAAQK